MAQSANVTIFGQTYTIAGDKDSDEIYKVAEYIDNKMRLISKMASQSGYGQVAVLAALNVADEYFDALSRNEKLKVEKEKLEKENEHYAEVFKEQQDDAGKAGELEKKCKEYESTIFDLQMENIQLKSAIEKFEKNNE